MRMAVLFDLGDTVLEEKSYDLRSGYAAVSKELSKEATFQDLSEAIVQFQEGNNEFKLREWIELNLSDRNQKTDVLDIEQQLWDKSVSLVPKTGVSEVLDFLEEKQVRIAAISNAIFSSQCMKAELDKHGLGRYFEFVISSADIGIKKPDIRIFELALSKLDADPLHTWYVGDSWDADILGAVSANLNAIWLKEGGQSGVKEIEHLRLSGWPDFQNLWKRMSI